MVNFWEAESVETYNARQAQQWAAKARQESFKFLSQQRLGKQGLTYEPETSLFYQPKITPRDLDSVLQAPVRAKRRPGGLIRDVGNLIDDVTSTAFMGEVRQPWDVLRPVQKLLEAEQKYVARPIASTILSPLPGDYEDLPGIVRMGAEVLADPLTYFGPGAITKAFKLAKIAPELKLMGPTLDSVFNAPGSRKAFLGAMKDAGIALTGVVGAEAADELGAPPIVGSIAGTTIGNRILSKKFSASRQVINPQDQVVYHGTDIDFEGMPKMGAPKKYSVSVPFSIYVSPSSQLAEGFTNGGSVVSSRIIPGVIKKGASLFDIRNVDNPMSDEFRFLASVVPAKMEDMVRAVISLFPKDEDVSHFMERPFLDKLPDREEFVRLLKKNGYHGVATPSEIVVLDERILEPLYTESRAMSQALRVEPSGRAVLEDISSRGLSTRIMNAVGLKFGLSPVSRPRMIDIPIDSLPKIGGQLGSQEGFVSFYKGHKYYIKPQSLERAYNEEATNTLYRVMGIKVPETELHVENGQAYIVSKFLPSEYKARSKEWWEGPTGELARRDAARGWATDVLLQHYDTVGLNYDNMFATDTGLVSRLEGGAGMGFRAMGAPKPGWFDSPYQFIQVENDSKSMRGGSPFNNAQLRSIFGGISDTEASTLISQASSRLRSEIESGNLEKAWKDAGIPDEFTQSNIRVLSEKVGISPAPKSTVSTGVDHDLTHKGYHYGAGGSYIETYGKSEGGIGYNVQPPGYKETFKFNTKEEAIDKFNQLESAATGTPSSIENSLNTHGLYIDEDSGVGIYKYDNYYEVYTSDGMALFHNYNEALDFFNKKVSAETDTIGTGAQTAINTGQLEELLLKMYDAPVDRFGASSRESVLVNARNNRTLTQQVRNQIAEWLPPSVVEFLRNRGIRLQDTDINYMINEWAKKSGLGPNYAAKTGDELQRILDASKKKGILAVDDISTHGQIVSAVRTPDILIDAQRVAQEHPELGLMSDGILHLEDLKENAKLFNLSPEQQAVLQALEAPMQIHKAFENLFNLGVKTLPNERGTYTHRELISTLEDRANSSIRVPSGPVVNPRYKSRQSFNRPRTETSKSAGISNGNYYLPYIEGQRARISQAYRMMADDYLSRMLEGYGHTISDLMPQEIKDGLKSTVATRRQVQWFKREINRAIHADTHGRSNYIPPRFTVLPELQQTATDAASATLMGRKADRLAVWNRVKDELDQLSKPIDNEYFRLKRIYKSTSDKIKYDKGSDIRRKYPVEFQGRYYSADQGGRELAPLTETHTPNSIMQWVNDVNNSVRPIMATLDLSFLGVQGLVSALSHPTEYYKAAKTIFSNGYGDYEDALSRSGVLDQMILDGVHWAARNDFAEFIFPSKAKELTGKVSPLLAKGMDVSNTYFTQFGNVLRAELYKMGVNTLPSDSGYFRTRGGKLATVAEKRQELARTVNLITGFSPADPTSIERSVAFAPRFFRSQLGLIADAVTKGDLSNRGATRAVSSMIASGTLLTMGINEALGNDTDFDPDSPNFMRIRIGDKDMSVFGTWDTLAKAATKLFTDGPEEAGSYLLRTKSSPVVGRLLDLIEGETLGGSELNWNSVPNILISSAELASTVLPLSVQGLLNEPPDPTNPMSLLGSATQFLGTKSTPLSPGERMVIRSEELSQKLYGKQWDNLEPFQRDRLRREYNLDLPSKSEIDRAFDFRTAISERFQNQQQVLDEQYAIGPEWIDAYHNLNRERSGAYGQWAEQNTDAVARIKHSKPTNANEQARQELFSLFDQAEQENWTPDQITQALDEFDSSLSESQRGYIERNTGLRDTPRVKEYKAAQRIMRPYWDIEDTIWERLGPKLDPSSPSLDSYVNKRIQEMQDQGVPDRQIVTRIQSIPLIKEINRAVSTLRERYRLKHAEVDRELVKWYGYKPIRESQR